jgi:two-component sensor histidine kinase
LISSGARILYIDDDPGLRRLASRALERRGYKVSCAADGAEGVAMAGAEAFDLIAVDHFMPGQDGLATIKQLRLQAQCPPIVYVTGSEDSRTAVAALKAGAIDYVVKTVGDDFFDLLASAFDQALSQVRLTRAKEDAEEALRASNERLKVMLGEVNHRVANSLQLVSALVQMQTNAVGDAHAKAALIDTQRRIQAVAQVHRRLYTADVVSTVDLADYLTALVEELRGTYASDGDGARRLALESDEVRVSTDQAVSLGIIVNELVANACKYAYPADRPGDVRISLKRDDDDMVVLTVEDDGCGLPAGSGLGTAPIKGTGLGARVIGAMASSLRSEVVFDPEHSGVRAQVRFSA